MDRTCPACSARLDQHATSCPNCGADLAAGGTDQSTEAGAAGEAVRNTAVAAHLSTFAGLVIPFGSVIGPLAVWLTRRHRDPFIDQTGREARHMARPGPSLTVRPAVPGAAETPQI